MYNCFPKKNYFCINTMREFNFLGWRTEFALNCKCCLSSKMQENSYIKKINYQQPVGCWAISRLDATLFQTINFQFGNLSQKKGCSLASRIRNRGNETNCIASGYPVLAIRVADASINQMFDELGNIRKLAQTDTHRGGGCIEN